jgi:hypothetical protein
MARSATVAGVTEDPGDGQTLTCPHCGLVLTVRRVKGGTRLSYSTRDWRRLCRHIALDSPVLCILRERSDGSTSEPGRMQGS